LKLLCGENEFWFFFTQILKYIFISILILLLCNFSVLSIFVYPIFAYMSLKLITNCLIFWAMLNFCGVLFSIFYFIINLSIIFLFVIMFMLCKSSTNCSCSNSGFSNYPYKSILIIFSIIMILVVLLLIITLIFSNFVSFSI
jgi:hypothetical protein